MRRSPRKVLRAAVSLGAISMFSLGTAGAALAAEELTIVTKTVETEEIDVDDDGKFSQGDQFIFTDDIEKKDDEDEKEKKDYAGDKGDGDRDDKKDDKGDRDDKKKDDDDDKDKDDDDKIGTVGGVCTATRVDDDDDFELDCQVIYSLPKGQIVTKALLDEDDFDKGKFEAAIIGGTDHYKDASGEAYVELTDDGSEVTFHINLNEY